MILNSNSKKVMFKELSGDQYGLKNIPQDTIKSFIDIGAAYGLVSILARLLHTKMKIVAIEPHTTTFSYLKQNTCNMDISVFHAAHGTGKPFYLQKERKMLLCNRFVHSKSNSQTIASYTISQLINMFRINTNSLALKMDTEGSEWYIFDNGDMKIIKLMKLAAFEVHDNGEGKTVDMFFSKIKKELPAHRVTMQRSSKTLAIVKASRFD